MREKNKSSSFYGQEYYQKARRKSYVKKQVYRERYKEFYDQEPQLQNLRYYKNLEEKCQMTQYFEFMKKVFMEFEHKTFVKTNEEYNTSVEQFTRKIKQQMNLFHQNYLCNEYITREQYMNLKLRSAEECKMFWQEQDSIKWENPKDSDHQRRLLTCNLCPIYIEQFEFNLGRVEKIIINSHHYWDRLNGRQKMKKYKNHVKRTIKVLLHELVQKCEYVPVIKNAQKMLKPHPRKVKKNDPIN